MLNNLKSHIIKEWETIKSNLYDMTVLFILILILLLYKDFFGGTFHSYATAIIKETFAPYLIIGLICLTPFYFFTHKSIYRTKSFFLNKKTTIDYAGILKFISFNKAIAMWNLFAGIAFFIANIYSEYPITPMFAVVFFLIWLIFSAISFILQYCKPFTIEAIMLSYALGILIIINVGMLPIPK